jgi:hypothetical protein
VAKLTRANFDAIRDHLFRRIHRTGEEIKNDFPNILRTAIEGEAWKQFTRADGTDFKNVVEWLHYTFPNGASMGQGRHAITYEDALQLTEVAPDVHRVLAVNAPKAKPGPKPNGTELTVSTPLILDRNHRNKTTSVLSVRLAQEKPKYYDAYLRGDYKSVTAAAIAAGLLTDDANLRRAKSAFRKMTTAQRKQFLGWIKSTRNGSR